MRRNDRTHDLSETFLYGRINVIRFTDRCGKGCHIQSDTKHTALPNLMSQDPGFANHNPRINENTHCKGFRARCIIQDSKSSRGKGAKFRTGSSLLKKRPRHLTMIKNDEVCLKQPVGCSRVRLKLKSNQLKFVARWKKESKCFSFIVKFTLRMTFC
ncbi:hypothetical protein TNCV_4195671 [Trichonephila clavipes]|nr:hypothetical protein TNCV_4195671 [Trichonephila clavipes]